MNLCGWIPTDCKSCTNSLVKPVQRMSFAARWKNWLCAFRIRNDCSARSLTGIADQIGMNDLSRVAGDVTRCIDARDAVALAATLSRLQRIGERSLTAIWDMQDVPV